MTTSSTRDTLRRDLIRFANAQGATSDSVAYAADKLAGTIIAATTKSESFWVSTRQVVHYQSADISRDEVARILAPHYAEHGADSTVEDAYELLKDMPDGQLIAVFEEINTEVYDLDPAEGGWENGGKGSDVCESHQQLRADHSSRTSRR